MKKQLFPQSAVLSYYVDAVQTLHQKHPLRKQKFTLKQSQLQKQQLQILQKPFQKNLLLHQHLLKQKLSVEIFRLQ